MEDVGVGTMRLLSRDEFLAKNSFSIQFELIERRRRSSDETISLICSASIEQLERVKNKFLGHRLR